MILQGEATCLISPSVCSHLTVQPSLQHIVLEANSLLIDQFVHNSQSNPRCNTLFNTWTHSQLLNLFLCKHFLTTSVLHSTVQVQLLLIQSILLSRNGIHMLTLPRYMPTYQYADNLRFWMKGFENMARSTGVPPHVTASILPRYLPLDMANWVDIRPDEVRKD